MNSIPSVYIEIAVTLLFMGQITALTAIWFLRANLVKQVVINQHLMAAVDRHDSRLAGLEAAMRYMESE